MKVPSEQVRTMEVAGWQGVHLLHYHLSSCSQKVRILLGELGVDFESHHVDLRREEQKSPWYLGINPNGVVPTLVHDGVVHVESNDIITYLDERFATERTTLIPSDAAARATMDELLALEDGLHAELRAITFTYLTPAMHGASAVDEEARLTVIARLDCVLGELSERLRKNAFLAGQALSLADVAWFITLHRLQLAGFPLASYRGLAIYYERLAARATFRAQVDAGPLPLRVAGAVYRWLNRLFVRSIAKDYRRWQALGTT